MRVLPTAVVTGFLALSAAAGFASPGQATVFIRVKGDVLAEYVKGWKQEDAQREVETFIAFKRTLQGQSGGAAGSTDEDE